MKLHQQSWPVNHKRVERLYTQASSQMRRRKCKKIPLGDWQPLVRPLATNQLWSMDFMFYRVAVGRTLKCLAIVDDSTH